MNTLKRRVRNLENKNGLKPGTEVIIATSQEGAKRELEERKAENPHAHFIIRIHSPVNKPVRAGLGAM